jgi:hypothetical protein
MNEIKFKMEETMNANLSIEHWLNIHLPSQIQFFGG